jgi:hypothetical protein
MFCGGTRVTKEHVFPEWLKRDIPVPLARLEVRDEFDTPLHTQYSFDIETKSVCGG